MIYVEHELKLNDNNYEVIITFEDELYSVDSESETEFYLGLVVFKDNSPIDTICYYNSYFDITFNEVCMLISSLKVSENEKEDIRNSVILIKLISEAIL